MHLYLLVEVLSYALAMLINVAAVLIAQEKKTLIRLRCVMGLVDVGPSNCSCDQLNACGKPYLG